jgi:hypothetical protein
MTTLSFICEFNSAYSTFIIIIIIQYIHPSLFAEVYLHFLIAGRLSEKISLGGARPGIELGPTLQQADAIPTKLCHSLLSYATLY